jgi:hypothetical protein
MDILLWIIIGPIAVVVILKLYNIIVRDFSPNKERVKKTYKSDIDLENAGEAWISLVMKIIWFLVKFGIGAVIVIVAFQINWVVGVLCIAGLIYVFTDADKYVEAFKRGYNSDEAPSKKKKSRAKKK